FFNVSFTFVFVFMFILQPPRSSPFPYTTLFRSLMKQHGTFLVPTLEIRECVGGNYPPEFVAKAERIMTAQLRNFRKAVEAGVKIDRKSTRLNSSHGSISYADFYLKTKKKNYGRH